MTTLAHLSDLHFGTEDPHLVEALLVDLASLRPTLVAISGDLTQRARRGQFAAARAFVDRLPAPSLVVPGNHDLPLHNLVRRLIRPLGRYRRFISNDLMPSFQNDEVAVLGINTARANTWKSGRVSRGQMRQIREFFSTVSSSACKVLVTHHPFLPPPDDPTQPLVGRGEEALRVAELSGTDLFLAGHLHVGYSGDVMANHLHVRRSMLVVQAGTATSRRRRGEPNTYNVIGVDGPRLVVTVRGWTGERFAPLSTTAYEKHGADWQRV